MQAKQIGKIRRAGFGLGGYQGARIVFTFHLAGEGWACVQDFECGWGHGPHKDAEWTHADRLTKTGTQAWKVVQLLHDAKVSMLHELEGKPIEATFISDRIESFRILTEAI